MLTFVIVFYVRQVTAKNSCSGMAHRNCLSGCSPHSEAILILLWNLQLLWDQSLIFAVSLCQLNHLCVITVVKNRKKKRTVSLVHASQMWCLLNNFQSWNISVTALYIIFILPYWLPDKNPKSSVRTICAKDMQCMCTKQTWQWSDVVRIICVPEYDTAVALLASCGCGVFISLISCPGVHSLAVLVTVTKYDVLV